MERLREYRIPLLTGLALLVFVVMVYFVWIARESSKLSSLQTQQTQLEGRQASLESEIVTLKKEKANLGTTCASLTNAVAQVPGVPQVDSFLQQVTQLAVSSGDPNTPSISVTEGTATTKPIAGATPVSVGLTLAGNYSQMSSFLRGLYTFPRLFTITTITISSAGGSNPGTTSPVVPPPPGGGGSYTLNLTGNIYYSQGEQNICPT